MKPAHARELVVIYHDCCIDGLASAWAVDKRYGTDENTRITYIPYAHHDSAGAEKAILAAMKKGSEAMFVDVAPRRAFLDRLLLEAPLKSVSVTDHHKSAYENLFDYKAPRQVATEVKLNLDPLHPSAAHMVWKELHADKPRPTFLDMIARMDVTSDLLSNEDYSAAALVDSKDIHNTHEAFKSFSEIEHMSFDEMAEKGRGIHLDQYNRISRLADNVMFTRLDYPELKGKWIPIVNADVQNFGRAISKYLRELGQETGADTAFAWFMQGNGAVTISIRSDGTPDASRVAEYISTLCHTKGGGHATSAAVHFKSLMEFSRHMEMVSRKNIKADSL